MQPWDDRASGWATLHHTVTAPTKRECQDCTWAGPVGNGANLLVVADGLGSAAYSSRGSEAAVVITHQIVAEKWRAQSNQKITSAQLQEWMVTIAAEWELWATRTGTAPAMLATTLAFCLFREPYFGMASVGDSFACVLTSDDECVLVDYVPRESGRASNVSPLSSQSVKSSRAFVLWDHGIDGILLSTDGLEGLVKIDRLRLAGSSDLQRVPSPDKVIGGMLRRFQETADANYVLANVERHQSLKGDDIGVAVATRFAD